VARGFYGEHDNHKKSKFVTKFKENDREIVIIESIFIILNILKQHFILVEPSGNFTYHQL
jgi:hypothetical protein